MTPEERHRLLKEDANSPDFDFLVGSRLPGEERATSRPTPARPQERAADRRSSAEVPRAAVWGKALRNADVPQAARKKFSKFDRA